MLLLIIYISLIITVLGAGLYSSYSDVMGMKIPNVLTVIIILSFVFLYGLLYVNGRVDDVFSSLLNHVMAAVFVFIITYVLFVVNILGAGDSKIASAFSLWLGFSSLPVFFFCMALIGGVLGVIAILIKRFKIFPEVKKVGWIVKLNEGKNVVPYGIAIFIGAIAGFFDAGFFDGNIINLLGV